MTEDTIDPITPIPVPEPLVAMHAFLQHKSSLESRLEEVPLNESQTLPQLNIALTSDLDLHVIFASDVIAAMGLESKSSHAVILQFYVPFSQLIPESIHPQIYQALNELNPLLPFGTLGLSEQQMLYFRYCLMLRERQPEGPLFLSLVLHIQHLIETLQPSLYNLVLHPEVKPELKPFKLKSPLSSLAYTVVAPAPSPKENQDYIPSALPPWLLGTLSASLTLLLGQHLGWFNAALTSTVLITGGAYGLNFYRLKKYNQQQLRQDYQKQHSKLKAIKTAQRRLHHKQQRLEQHHQDLNQMIETLNQEPLISPQQIFQTRSHILSLRTLEAYVEEQFQQVDSQMNRSARTENQVRERLEQLLSKLNQQDERGLLFLLQQRTEQLLHTNISEESQSLADLQQVLEQIGFQVGSVDSHHILWIYFPQQSHQTHQRIGISLSRPCTTPALYTLNIFASFHLAIALEIQSDLTPLLNLFNRLTPVGTFSLENQSLIYMYSLFQSDCDTDVALVVELLDFVHYFSKQFVPLLLAVANGEQNLETMLNNILP